MNAKWNLGLSCLLALASAACSGSKTSATAPGGEAGTERDAAPSDTPGDASARAPVWTTAVLATFDPAQGQLPEGVAVKEGFAYAGFAPLGEIAKVDLKTGKSTAYATIPKPVSGKGFMTGLAFGPDGLLYAALVSFDPSVAPGIYRIPATGGKGDLFAKDPTMAFPNGLAFDATGSLFVTDSGAGAVFKIASSGVVSAWASSPLLAGDKSACGGSGNPFDIGANGLVERSGTFYVTNTDKGSVVRVAVKSDGKAEAAEIAAGPDCAALGGADGVTKDADGNLIIAVNRQNKIVRLTSGGAIEQIAGGELLDFPASLDWNGPTLVATNFALANASTGKTARPGLLSLTRER